MILLHNISGYRFTPLEDEVVSELTTFFGVELKGGDIFVADGGAELAIVNAAAAGVQHAVFLLRICKIG